METGIVFVSGNETFLIQLYGESLCIEYQDQKYPQNGIELPPEAWSAFAAAITALLARRDAAIAAEVQDEVQR